MIKATFVKMFEQSAVFDNIKATVWRVSYGSTRNTRPSLFVGEFREQIQYIEQIDRPR